MFGQGGGVISNPKIYVADFCHYKGYFGHEFRRKSATWFSENEGGGQRPFWTFPKIHPFWRGDASLRADGANKNLHLYLNNVMEQVTTRDKLHHKEKPLCGLEWSIECSEESAAVAMSKDFSLKEDDGGAVLAENVFLADGLNRTQLLIWLPLRQNYLIANIFMTTVLSSGWGNVGFCQRIVPVCRGAVWGIMQELGE